MAYHRERISVVKRKQKVIGIIDADITAYEVASVNETRIDWDSDGDKTQYTKSHEGAFAQADYQVARLRNILKLDEVVICLSGPNNFRKKILETYKFNRKAVMRPLLLKPIKEYLADNYPTLVQEELEADDLLGILSTGDYLPKEDKKIIISIDKDLTQIPGWYFNPSKDTKAREITKEEGNYFHYLQILTGDWTDGYKGCPGIGPKKAEKLLAENKGNEWEAIVKMYESKDLTEADALVQAQVARICQSNNYNFKTKEVTPWQPGD